VDRSNLFWRDVIESPVRFVDGNLEGSAFALEVLLCQLSNGHNLFAFFDCGRKTATVSDCIRRYNAKHAPRNTHDCVKDGERCDLELVVQDTRGNKIWCLEMSQPTRLET
jgi:hypothetical protein